MLIKEDVFLKFKKCRYITGSLQNNRKTQTRACVDRVSLKQRPGGYSQKNCVGVCGPLPKTLTLFMTKICDIPYPIYDLTFKSKPCF